MEECFLCKESNSEFLHDSVMMTYHSQSGDRCCMHCAESIYFSDCIFCYKVDTCTKLENDKGHSGCSEWDGDKSFLTC